MEKTSTGLTENVAGLLCYILGWVTGIVFLLIEPDNKFVRYHAMQSIIVFGIISVAAAIFSWIPVVGFIISWIIGVISFILWIVLMFKAYQGTKYKLPWTGDMAEKFAEGNRK